MRSKNTAHYSTILNFVNKYFDDIGRSPSTREIESATGISRPTVQRYLRELCERGEIEYDGHRGIITEYMRGASEGTSPVLMGNSIPCGMLSEVGDAELESIRMPTALIGNGDFFLLRARGNSMINAGIDDGDLVLIKRTGLARTGSIVVALVNGTDTTLKRYLRDTDGNPVLRAENPRYSDIHPFHLAVQGVAVKVIKDVG